MDGRTPDQVFKNLSSDPGFPDAGRSVPSSCARFSDNFRHEIQLVMCLVLSALHFMPTWEMGRRNVSVAPDSSLDLC